MGKYFTVKACPNLSFDYRSALIELKAIDNELYLILDRFMNAWVQYDYNDNDPVTGGYDSFLYRFIKELENWTVGKQIQFS